MKKFISAALLVLLAAPAWIILTQKKSPVPTDFFPREQGEKFQARPLILQEESTPAPPTAVAQSNTAQMEIPALAARVLDRQALAESRRQALLILINQGAAARQEIAVIASKPLPRFANAQNPHSVESGWHNFEKGLRITAIEALDQIALQGVDVVQELNRIRDTQNENDLVFLAGVALDGIAQGRPGKVARFIDQVFDEALNKKQ